MQSKYYRRVIGGVSGLTAFLVSCKYLGNGSEGYSDVFFRLGVCLFIGYKIGKVAKDNPLTATIANGAVALLYQTTKFSSPRIIIQLDENLY